MKINEVIKKLTIDEKISLLEGKSNWETANIDRLNIKSIFVSDGPHGLRKEIVSDKAVAESIISVLYPTESTISQTFNEELLYQMGKAIAKECVKNDVDILLAPGINIKRHPLCGRNFEYYSEDPYLSGMLAKSFNSGVEAMGVGSCVKHFACNNQEKYRMSVSSVVDERTLHEIYLKAFRLSINYKTSMVMASYNKLNGKFACQNEYLLKDILKSKYNFKGVVVSDWGAVSDRCEALKAGLDLEMPTTKLNHAKDIKNAYLNGDITNEEIDEAVSRILTLVNRFSQDKEEVEESYLDNNHQLAIKIATESIVLAKNESNILPLDTYDRVLFLGELFEKPRMQGRGSSQINPYKIVKFDEAFKNYSSIKYLKGYNLDNEHDTSLINEAKEEAKKYEKVVIMVGQTDHLESEGYDRFSYQIPQNQLKLIKEIAKVNKKVIVVVNNGSSLDLNFNYLVKGLLIAGLGGEGYLEGLKNVLYGYHNPYAKLTESYAIDYKDHPSDKNFANSDNSVYYNENIFVGYRYFAHHPNKLVYPFGHGLSYSTFEVSNLKVSQTQITKTKKIKVTYDVKNTSNRNASYITQVYIGCKNTNCTYPLRQLAKFKKIDLKKDEKVTVEFELSNQDFSFYNPILKDFTTLNGTYTIEVCENSNEVLLNLDVTKNVRGEVEYNEDVKLTPYLSDDDFKKLFNFELPSKNKKKHELITPESTFDDYKKKLIGKLVFKILNKKIMNAEIIKSNDWLIDFYKYASGDICIRNIPQYTDYKINFDKLDGICDIMNNHFIRGIRKLKDKK